MDLHFQSLQLRLGQLCSEYCRLRFSFTKPAVVVEGMSHDESGPVNRQTLMEVIRAECVVAPENREGRIAIEIYITQIPDQGRRSGQDQARENYTRSQMNKQISWKMLAKFKSSREQDD